MNVGAGHARAIGRERSKARVRLARTHESERWARHFRCNRRELAQAVGAVGGDPVDIAAYLERLLLRPR